MAIAQRASLTEPPHSSPPLLRKAAGFRRPAVRAAIVVALFLSTGEGPAAAEVQTIAVVAFAAGRATIERATALERRPLLFKDEVMLGDRITTSEQSTLRLLLAPKIVVTVGEGSELTITKTAGTLGTIQLRSGIIGVAVSNERLGTSELLEIRTPNLTAVLGAGVSLVEVRETFTPSLPPTGTSGVTSRFISISGVSHVTTPLTRPGRDSIIAMNPLTSLSRTGSRL